jgi:hypothetical protein
VPEEPEAEAECRGEGDEDEGVEDHERTSSRERSISSAII